MAFTCHLSIQALKKSSFVFQNHTKSMPMYQGSPGLLLQMSTITCVTDNDDTDENNLKT